MASFNYDEYDQYPSTLDQGPPPLPPPHSVSLNNLARSQSHQSFDESLANRNGIVASRTPSPWRNAMNDVWSSLNNMETGAHSPSKDSNGGYSHNSHQHQNVQSESHFNSPSQRRPDMARQTSNFSSLSNRDYDNKPFNASRAEPNAPFDSGSYAYSSSSPNRENLYNVKVSRRTSTESMDRPYDVTRTDTHKSFASDVTNDQSVFSQSTTPTDFSNSSTSSAGSAADMRSKTRYTMESAPGLNSPAVNSFETPVTLPKARQQSRSPHKGPMSSDSRSTLKKPAGLIKKFLANAATSYRNGGAHPGFERANSSLSFSEAVRKVSGKSYTGRTAISSHDLYPVASASSFQPSGETDRWIEVHRNVHRTNTLTKHEKMTRRGRPQVDGIRSIQPIEELSRIAGNETSEGYTLKDTLNIGQRDFSVVYSNIFNLNSWPYVTPGELARGHIIQKFSDPLCQLRAAFDFCATKLKWESLMSNDYHDEGPNSLTRVMQSRRASCWDVSHAFKQMCDALSIRCNVISGYLKGPGEVWHNPGIPRPNHHWNSVLIDGCWRMVDASLASPTFPTRDLYSKCDKREPEYFYFLTKPNELVYTHVPYDSRDQHIVPSLPHDVLIALPLAGPVAFEYNLELKYFSTSLTRLQGLDIAELTVAVPNEVEVFAEVLAGTFPAGTAHMLLNAEEHKTSPALSQVFWQEGKRYYRVKAVLPPTHNQGALNVYAGPKGTLQSITKNTLPLAFSVPVIQREENPLLNFVIRHPTPHSGMNDIYINEPQCKDLVYGQSYVFAIDLHPSKGELRSNVKAKMAVQTPSGRIVKLQKTDNMTRSYGRWEGNIKCMDVGTWRGLVLSDSGNAWSVYAEWTCA